MDNTRSTEQEKICANSGTSQFSPHSPLEAESDVDSSDSEQEGMEEEMKENIEKWKEALKTNPKDLDAYNNLIEAYRASGEVEELRSTRLQMKKAFPLSPGGMFSSFMICSNME